ncbi:MAG: DUF4399 domain-containing protein [Chloroflexi bacterium]|nr:DUF4399 domain-containing protein [Chloroflexota bacterium]
MARKRLHALFTFVLAVLLVLTLLVVFQSSVSKAAPVAQEEGQTYIVKAGDSLYEISGQFYGKPANWPAIVEATNAKAAQDKSFATITNPSSLNVGQKLWIPSPTVSQPTAAATPATKPTPTPIAPKTAISTTPRVFFTEPSNGASVPLTFTAAMSATGLIVEKSGEIHSGAGHMHILVDTDFVPAGDVIINDAQHIHFGKGQLTAPITLTPGIHVLHLQFANGAHIALDGPQYRDTITVTAAATSTQPAVHFVEPHTGATVPPNFMVKMAATGLTVEKSGEIHSGAGHMHILVDTDFVPAGDVIINDAQHIHFGKGQLTTPITLTPGIHVLHLQFANGAHIALDGPQYRDTITVTVAPTSTQPAVHFVEPLDGAIVPPKFAVKMAASHLTVEPAGEIHSGAGHMHILVDTDFVPAGDVIINDAQHIHFGKGQLTTTLTLDPGVHILHLQFANGAHVALDGLQYRDTITVTVKQ